MKRREPPLTSSGVRRRARNAVEKRLLDLTEDSLFESAQTYTNITETPSSSTNSDSSSGLFDHFGTVGIDTQTHRNTENQHVSESESESDSESEFQCVEPDSLAESLANWAVRFGVSLVALTALLSLLRVYHSELPKDARTILKTNTECEILNKCGGLYHYRGFLTALYKTLTLLSEKIANGFRFSLQINIDGLLLFKSTNLQLWPILVLLKSVQMKEPVVVGLFCGPKKPTSSAEYLRDFSQELKQLQEGFNFGGKKFFIELHSVVCDTPARAFVKNTKAHNAYHGWDKCCQPGSYFNNRMTYPENDFALRTDGSFSDRLDEDHHHDGPHGFSGLDFGMVSRFPLDYMHVACLGVTRRLLNVWMRGPLKFRLSSSLVDRISQSLIQMRNYIPVEFARKPRSLRDLDHWKATELRQFMLHTGAVALAPYLESNLYNNFMLFSTSMCILVSPLLCSLYSNYADTLLRAFVSHVGELYGQDALVYNLHVLVHLSADAERYGSLDSISAFPFENYLCKLKRFVRKPNFPLAQIIRRLSEVEKISTVQLPCKNLIMQHYLGPVPDGLQVIAQFRGLQNEKWLMKVSTGDDVFTIDGDLCVIHNIIQCLDGIYVVYQIFADMEVFFKYPMSSDFLRVFVVSQPTGPFEVSKVSQVSQKCMLLPNKDKYVVMPLLHSHSCDAQNS